MIQHIQKVKLNWLLNLRTCTVKDRCCKTTGEIQVRLRLEGFIRTLESNKNSTNFYNHVFEAVIDRVIIGLYDDDGTANTIVLRFVYKTGLEDKSDGKKRIPIHVTTHVEAVALLEWKA